MEAGGRGHGGWRQGVRQLEAVGTAAGGMTAEGTVVGGKGHNSWSRRYSSWRQEV